MLKPPQAVLYAVDLCDCEKLQSLAPEALAALFRATLERAGAHVVEAVSHNFPGRGQTAVLILSESHAVLHTWPEGGTVHLDIFSCSPALDSRAAVAELGRTLGARTVAIQEIPRADGHPIELEPRGA